MKLKRTLLGLMCVSFSVFAAEGDVVPNQYNGSDSGGSEALAKYVLNLGKYLGFDVSKAPDDKAPLSQKLLDLSALAVTQQYVTITFLGAIPVDAVSAAFAQLVPNSYPGASIVNSFANATFKLQNYSSPAQQGSPTFTVTPLMDQQKFQQDPVSQSVLNILGTPDYSVCLDNDGAKFVAGCELLFQNKVMANIIGPLPAPDVFFSPKYNEDYNQQLLSQLNSNSLMGPLMYSADTGAPSTSSGTPDEGNKGLTAETQLQQAANFVRYASGAVAPISLPRKKAYENLYNIAVPIEKGAPTDPTPEQLKTQGILNGYFASLRVYAAQSSVGIGNLYYLLSKRLPQNPTGGTNAATSQALSEFNMATRRLLNPADLSEDKRWANQINNASPGTVEKEIAVLLAEINYQMYLDRQIQERILLTNTIMLMQNTKASEPTADFATQGNTSDDAQ